MKTTVKQSRKHPRIKTDAQVDLTGSRDVLLFHQIEDISLGGLRLKTPTLEPLGTVVDLSINFPDLGESLDVQGEVVWTNEHAPQDMGIKFVGLTAHDREVLARYMERRQDALLGFFRK